MTKTEFNSALGILTTGGLKGAKPTAQTLSVWYEEFKGFDPEKLKKAFLKIVRNPEFRFYPTMSEVLEVYFRQTKPDPYEQELYVPPGESNKPVCPNCQGDGFLGIINSDNPSGAYTRCLCKKTGSMEALGVVEVHVPPRSIYRCVDSQILRQFCAEKKYKLWIPGSEDERVISDAVKTSGKVVKPEDFGVQVKSIADRKKI